MGRQEEDRYFQDRGDLIESTQLDLPRQLQPPNPSITGISPTSATRRIAIYSGIGTELMGELIKGTNSLSDSLLTGVGILSALSLAYYKDLSTEMQEDRGRKLSSTYETLSQEREKRFNPNSRKIDRIDIESIAVSQYIFYKNMIENSDDRPEQLVMKIEDLCFELLRKYNLSQGNESYNLKINRSDFIKYVYSLMSRNPQDNIENLSKKEKIQIINQIRSTGLSPQVIERNKDNWDNNFREDYIISEILKSANPNTFRFGERIYQLDQNILSQVLKIGYLTEFNVYNKGVFPVFSQYISFILKDYARYAYRYNRKMFNSVADISYEQAKILEEDIRKTWIKEKFEKNIGAGLLSTLTAISINETDFIERILHILSHI